MQYIWIKHCTPKYCSNGKRNSSVKNHTVARLAHERLVIAHIFAQRVSVTCDVCLPPMDLIDFTMFLVQRNRATAYS